MIRSWRLSLMSWMKSHWLKIEKIEKSILQRACTVDSTVTKWIRKCSHVRASLPHFVSADTHTWCFCHDSPSSDRTERCIVSGHIFSLSGSLRRLQFFLMYQPVVIIRIFPLDFITVGEDDITYVKSNLMIMILNWKFEILQELQHYVIDDVLYLSNLCCRHVNTNH